MIQKQINVICNNEIKIYITYSEVGRLFNLSGQQIKNIINKKNNNFIIFDDKKYILEYHEKYIDDIVYKTEKIEKIKAYCRMYRQKTKKHKAINQ
jgi:hypothetical protein